MIVLMLGEFQKWGVSRDAPTIRDAHHGHKRDTAAGV